MTRIAINGFGRIGRAVLRSAVERGSELELVAVNDVADAATLGHLLARDSVYGRFPEPVEIGPEGLTIGERSIAVLAEKDPTALPWRELGVDVVLECTGKFRTRETAAKHLEAGAGKVILSAPAKDAVDANVVLGVNFDEAYDPERHHVITNASCTTNCLAPVAKVLHEAVGIRHGLMTTIHAYTADQQLIDRPAQGPAPRAGRRRQPRADLHRRREGARPGHPGARRTATRVRRAGAGADRLARGPHRRGRARDERRGGQRGVRPRADSGPLTGILAYSEEPIVSSDIVKSPHSSIFDAPLTAVIDGTQVKVVAWYDNEWGYANRLLELAERVGATVPAAA